MSDFSKYSIQDLSDAYYDLHKADYKEKPVDIDTFVTDGAFLGSAFPKGFRSFWMDELRKIHPTPFFTSCLEVLCLLPIGSGKTTAATVSILYNLHTIACMHDPVASLGLGMQGTKIVYMIFSATKSLAGDLNTGVFFNLLSAAPWFRDVGIQPKITSFKTHPTVELNAEISLTIGSTEKHALGMAVLGGYLDEASFQSNASDQAHKTYSAIMRRRESRFLQSGGFLPGIFWAASSPNSATDFLESQIDQRDTTRKLQAHIIANIPIWEIRREDGIYCGETFPIFMGSETDDPQILPMNQTGRFQTFAELREDFESKGLVYDVPIELKNAFETDLLSAIRDHAGLSISHTSRLIWSKKTVVDRMVTPNRFSKEIFSFDFFESAKSGSLGIKDFVTQEYFLEPEEHQMQRYIHIDVALSGDRWGVAAVYATQRRRSMESHTLVTRPERIFKVDFAFAIEAIKGQQIPFHTVVDFFCYLRDNHYPIAHVSADSFQSAQLLQELRLLGYETSIVSVDRTREPYLALKRCLIAGMLDLPQHDILKDEILGLEDNGKKVDHSSDTSKDIADGVAGALFTCREKEQSAVSSAKEYFAQQKNADTRLEQTIKTEARKMLMRNLI